MLPTSSCIAADPWSLGWLPLPMTVPPDGAIVSPSLDDETPVWLALLWLVPATGSGETWSARLVRPEGSADALA